MKMFWEEVFFMVILTIMGEKKVDCLIVLVLCHYEIPSSGEQKAGHRRGG